MSLILFDDKEIRYNLMPFTLTRPVAEIRVGILTIAEKWKRSSGMAIYYDTEAYLADKYPTYKTDFSIYVNGAVSPTPELTEAVKALKPGQVIKSKDTLIAHTGNPDGEILEFEKPLTVISHVWEIFQKNGEQIRQDAEYYFSHLKNSPIEDKHTIIYGAENIYAEPGVQIRAAVLNAENGPIYLGKNSEIQEGSVIRGPFALCEGAVVNMAGKVRGDSTVGPYSKVGGEISNSVIFGYSNKAHDGFIGNTVIGEWCNLGADTNTSNLKNNYGDVRLYNFSSLKPESTGLQFCGTMMGDYSRTSINTMLNTGTVVGVFANIFGNGFPPKYVPSFAWAGSEEMELFHLEKAYEIADRAMARRNVAFGEADKKILDHLHAQASHIFQKK